MKKISLLVAASVLSMMVFGQRRMGASSAHGVSFGIKGGVNLANIQENDNTYINTRTAYHFGGLVHIPVSRAIAVQPEIVYSSQGAVFSLTGYTGTDKLNYINIPVLVQYVSSGGFRLETGPQVGFLTNAKFKLKSNGSESDIKSGFKSTDFAWAFGAGFAVNQRVGIDARYNLGISNIISGELYSAKNKVWQLGLFYQLH